MTLQERLRVQYNLTAMDEFEEAADALDAKDARIKELEGALIMSVQGMEWIEAEASARLRFRDNERYPALCNALANIRAVMVSARAALKEPT